MGNAAHAATASRMHAESSQRDTYGRSALTPKEYTSVACGVAIRFPPWGAASCKSRVHVSTVVGTFTNAHLRTCIPTSKANARSLAHAGEPCPHATQKLIITWLTMPDTRTSGGMNVICTSTQAHKHVSAPACRSASCGNGRSATCRPVPYTRSTAAAVKLSPNAARSTRYTALTMPKLRVRMRLCAVSMRLSPKSASCVGQRVWARGWWRWAATHTQATAVFTRAQRGEQAQRPNA